MSAPASTRSESDGIVASGPVPPTADPVLERMARSHALAPDRT
ncbi:hypothetical protein B005_2984 [Nocardiopsis alba ATCC BAA-2165]|uniref:Uncharacterized protein n=1 Tax=Nocardiopsis alba (strain ATCC BAA-2165 / BE74) TaxID=1205910 RepID=J7KYV2_NOCAA|nr:hypothetical protein B005_2984 [Nocardiopsis alba ATCC BAA-2165]